VISFLPAFPCLLLLAQSLKRHNSPFFPLKLYHPKYDSSMSLLGDNRKENQISLTVIDHTVSMPFWAIMA